MGRFTSLRVLSPLSVRMSVLREDVVAEAANESRQGRKFEK